MSESTINTTNNFLNLILNLIKLNPEYLHLIIYVSWLEALLLGSLLSRNGWHINIPANAK